MRTKKIEVLPVGRHPRNSQTEGLGGVHVHPIEPCASVRATRGIGTANALGVRRRTFPRVMAKVQKRPVLDNVFIGKTGKTEDKRGGETAAGHQEKVVSSKEMQAVSMTPTRKKKLFSDRLA